MFEVTIQLPATITVPLGDTGKSTEVAVQSIAKHADVLRFACLNGFIGALNNISRGKDEQGKALSDDNWAAARAKKVDTWLAGEWAARASGGERATTAIREAYVDFVKRETKASQSQVEQQMKALVAEMFGKDESATFSRFMDAWATKRAKRDGTEFAEVRDAFEAKFRKMAEAAAASRAKAASKLNLDDLDI